MKNVGIKNVGNRNAVSLNFLIASLPHLKKPDLACVRVEPTKSFVSAIEEYSLRRPEMFNGLKLHELTIFKLEKPIPAPANKKGFRKALSIAYAMNPTIVKLSDQVSYHLPMGTTWKQVHFLIKRPTNLFEISRMCELSVLIGAATFGDVRRLPAPIGNLMYMVVENSKAVTEKQMSEDDLMEKYFRLSDID
ncbi:hypothetical protein BD410DRAFT_876114 [Rickenella mellea]|uniref:Uncharacterized protein n=1 Tax=Rickenella mellea TaxID=50990 RepID=A0A4Y7QLD7_9AGAM|nr:hypothetical protein BD410DRAFT_876114 [Rickenella mellea]